MIKIHVLPCGEVGVDPAVPDRSISKNPLAYTGLFRSSEKRIWLPVKAFLIDHPKGTVLVDTGWDSAVRDHPVKTLSFPLWFASKPRLPEGTAVDEQLAGLGIKPGDLSYVVMTHMDIDHGSGLRLVKDAQHIMLSPEEWKAIHSNQVRYSRKFWKGIHLELIPFSRDDTAPFGQSWDIFGDQTVNVFAIPGHTQGSVGIRVSGDNGYVLIVGDVGYNRKSWDQTKLPGPVFNQPDMMKALKWVQANRQDPQCIAVLATHDPDDKNVIIEIQEET